MFKKKSLFLIAFVFGFLMLDFGGIKQNTLTAKGACSIDCIGITTESVTGEPVKCEYDIDIWTTSNKICTVGELDSADAFFSTANPCYNSDTNAIPSPNTQACRHNSCPDFNHQNGAVCEVISADGLLCGNEYKSSGKWDASEKKCVQCSGKKEGIICGDSLGIYENKGTCIGTNSTTFETACDASVAADCDDKTEGSACAGGVCDASGQCVASSDLFLTVSANPSAIEVNETSTITFLVMKNGAPVDAATVENITVTGGFVGATSCATNVSGECAVEYTAPPIAGLYGVNAEKATKAGETESASAGVVITVSSSAIAPCGPEIGVLCNPVDNASNFYDVIVIAIRYLLYIIALITLLFIVISGIKYLTSFGNEEKMRSAKEGLFSAVFGLVLVLMANAILEVIIKILSS